MKTLTQSIKSLLLIVATLGLTSMIVGCDDGKSSSRNRLDPRMYNPYTVGPNGFRHNGCQNCGYNNIVDEGVGVVNDSILDMEIGLTIYSEAAYGTTGYINNYNYAGSFNGSVQAQGVMTVYNDSSVVCPLPPGNYMINTLQPGQLSGYDWNNGLVLVAQNHQYGTNVIIQMSGGITDMRDALGNEVGPYVAADGYQYYRGLQGFLSMQVEGPWGTCLAGGNAQYYMSPPSTAL